MKTFQFTKAGPGAYREYATLYCLDVQINESIVGVSEQVKAHLEGSSNEG